MAEVSHLKTYLRNLFPHIVLDLPEINRIMDSKSITYDEKASKILNFYFKSKRSKLAINPNITLEAGYIRKLLPTLTREYDPEKLLTIFKDMPDRKEIVLRLILNKIQYSSTSATVTSSSAVAVNQGNPYYLMAIPVPSTLTLKLFLRELFPDIRFDIELNRIMDSQVLTNDVKVAKILDFYFRSKRRNLIIAPSILEAVYIRKLLPTLSRENDPEILLTIFRDMPDRKEIVLKLILSKIKCTTYKSATVTSSSAVDMNRVGSFGTYPAIPSTSAVVVLEEDDSEKPDQASDAFDMSVIFVTPPQEPFPVGAESDGSVIQKNQVVQFVQNRVDDIPNGGGEEEEEGAVFSASGEASVHNVIFYHPMKNLREAIAITYDISKPSTSGSSNNNSLKPTVEKGPLIEPKEDKDVDVELVNRLCGIFPDVCPTYIKRLCRGQAMNNEILNYITDLILNSNNNYPKRPPANVGPEAASENQLEILSELLPDADPDYLRMKFDEFEGNQDMFTQFINEALGSQNYPTNKEYLRRQQLSAQEKQYTTDFNVESFIKIIPDPHTFFSDPERVVKMDDLSTHYAYIFLKNTFNKLPVRIIQRTFTKHKSNLYKTFKELKNGGGGGVRLKNFRKPIDMPNSVQNIPLLQEIAYYSHLEEIDRYLKEVKENEDAERQEALNQGLMKTCGCCYDEEVLEREIYCCENNCAFCKSCVVKSTEVLFGEGKLDFPCLANCSSTFSLQTLQAALSPKLFSKIAQKKALEEIKSAGIEELETCPFCDFATIPAEGYNIFTCMNPECMKESCRVCKEPSHAPLRCEEIEKDEDVKARVFVENKMTEALLRKCWKCGIKFFKEEGCNKMTCSCGAKMCYVCGQPVTDYTHFNGIGGDRFDLCPLYSDTNKMNEDNVLRAAAAAKTEIGYKELKYDPTADVQEHYKERAKKLPPPPILNPVDVENAAAFVAAFNARLPQRENQ